MSALTYAERLRRRADADMSLEIMLETQRNPEQDPEAVRYGVYERHAVYGGAA